MTVRDGAPVADGKCWICGRDSHDLFKGLTDDSKHPELQTPAVQDAIAHVLFAAHGPIRKRHKPGSPGFIAAYKDVAVAVGNLGGCISSLVGRAAADVAVEAFFTAIVQHSGPGTYQFEIAPRGGLPQPHRIH